MCHVKSSQVQSHQAVPSRPVKSRQVYECIFEHVSKQNLGINKLPYLSLTFSLCQIDLFKHLRALFHHQGLLVSVG